MHIKVFVKKSERVKERDGDGGRCGNSGGRDSRISDGSGAEESWD